MKGFFLSILYFVHLNLVIISNIDQIDEQVPALPLSPRFRERLNLSPQYQAWKYTREDIYRAKYIFTGAQIDFKWSPVELSWSRIVLSFG